MKINGRRSFVLTRTADLTELAFCSTTITQRRALGYQGVSFEKGFNAVLSLDSISLAKVSLCGDGQWAMGNNRVRSARRLVV